MKRRVLIFVALLLCVAAPLSALTDWSSWWGDTASFVYDGKKLKIAPDAASTSATISCHYDFDGRAIYKLTTYLDRAPTSRNGFEWRLLSFAERAGEEAHNHLYVAPTGDNKSLALFSAMIMGARVKC